MGKVVSFPAKPANSPAPLVIDFTRRDRPEPTIGEAIQREKALRRLSAAVVNLSSCSLAVSDTLDQIQRGAGADVICDQRMHEALVGAAHAAIGIIDILSTNPNRAMREALRLWLEQNGESTDG